MTIHKKNGVDCAMASWKFAPLLMALLTVSLVGTLRSTTTFGAEPTISASGKSTVDADPQIMRVRFRLLEKGKTIEDALAKLTDRQAAAAIQLEKLNATEGSVSFGKPKKHQDRTQDPEVKEMIRMQFEQQGRKVPAGLNADPGISLTVEVTAEWAIPDGKPAIQLGFVHELQTRINETDIAGIKEPKKLTPAEKELAEELEGLQRNMGYGGRQDQDPRKASYEYLAEPDEASRKEAFGKAVKKAREHAELLAGAADMEIGALIRLSGDFQQAGGYQSEYGFGYDDYGRPIETSDEEWVTTELETVTYTVVVQLEYVISP